MYSASAKINASIWRGGLAVRNIRMITGLILFGFVLTHLLNHSLGLISIEAMDSFRQVRTGLTRSLPGTAILLLAAVIHSILGVEKIVSRRLSAISTRGLAQIASGILIPLLLTRHIIGMRFAHELFGVNDNYEYALWAMWPGEAWRQGLLIVLVWGHGSIGIYMWLRFKRWFATVREVLFALAVLIPALAFAGFAVAGREFHQTRDFTGPLSSEQYQTLIWLMDVALYMALALISGLALIKFAQWLHEGFKPKVRVTYNNSVTKTAPAGLTLLEISRLYGIPHASICGGLARCSTCRVQILSGAEYLAPAGAPELKALARAGINDASVRLACQIRPRDTLSVIPLVPAGEAKRGKLSGDRYDRGVEHVVTLMFIDIRGFTKFSEGRLPYDVVHTLNQYMGQMSDVITAHGGYVDKFMGDGIMAIFGMETSPADGARQAMKAAALVSEAMEELNTSHENDLAEPLRIGIGIHTGEAILGRVGASKAHGAGERITALGDTVNTASRLEALTKEAACEVMVSQETLTASGVEETGFELQTFEIRGRNTQIAALALTDARKLISVLAK